MMSELLDLVRYNDWANARLVAAVTPLPEEAFSAPITSSFGSLRETLAHIVSAEWIWLRRWTGESPTVAPAWVAEGTRSELVAKLEEIRVERSRFLEALPAQAFQSVIEYRTLAGQSYRNTLADLVRHVVNHSTYHRGQAATQLRQLQVVPPSTDFVRYRNEHA